LVGHDHEVSAVPAELEFNACSHFNAIKTKLEYNDRAENTGEEISQKPQLLNVEATSTDSPRHQNQEEATSSLSLYGRDSTVIQSIEELNYFERPSPTGDHASRTEASSNRSPLLSPQHTTKWTRISEKCLDFWLVKVELETHEKREPSQTSPKHGHSTLTTMQRSSIQAHFRVPFFSRKLIIEVRSLPFSSYNGFDMQLRTRNIVPKDSPIFVGCEDLDFVRVKGLFESKAASPFDYYHDAEFGDCSLINHVCGAVFKRRPVESFEHAADLINYILPFYNVNPRMLNHDKFSLSLSSYLKWGSGMAFQAHIDVVRAILLHSNDNPFGEISQGYLFVETSISLSEASLPLQPFLLEQSYHDIDGAHDWAGRCVENDRTMLCDPKGERMQNAIMAGCQYIFNCEVSLYLGPIESMYGMLRSASNSRTPEIEVCCRNRLLFLLRHRRVAYCQPNFIYEYEQLSKTGRTAKKTGC
jgi:hypothetical protein